MDVDNDFKQHFKAITGHEPLSWQQRLYNNYFSQGNLPSVIDIPTGLGKTMVMAIWLIARARHPANVSTRLIYVVDRRTVVDQATDMAEELAYLLAPEDQKNDRKIIERKPELTEYKKKHAARLAELRQALGYTSLAISTLRGQLADNREWSRDPSRPAIIIGTVDLIGSALLFSGYRSSSKRRPLEAGLLGQDSLLVLDEAHLSKPFEKLLNSIKQFQQTRDCRETTAGVKPLQIIRMSATSGEVMEKGQFQLEDFDLLPQVPDCEGKLINNPVVTRCNAPKQLWIKPDVDPPKLNQTMAEYAIELANQTTLCGKRIVVFVRKPEDAKTIATMIREHAIKSVNESMSKKTTHKPYKKWVAVLTGTMRGLERDALVKTPVLQRFLDGAENPNLDQNQKPVFLVSTSAGEVGFDLNADHMICDATTIDSLIQRLGRVNRRG